MTEKVKRTVGRLLATYLVILLIPICASVFVFQPVYRQVQENTRDTVSGSLQQTAGALKQRMEEIETIAYKLSQNSELIRFGRYADGFQGETPSRLLELQNNLPNYSVSNKFIRDYFVLYPESGIVLNNRVAYDYEDFFRSYIGYSGIGTE